MRLSQNYHEFKGVNDQSTSLTEVYEGNIILKSTRPALIISSTSWTEDEDFSILLLSLRGKNSINKKNNPLNKSLRI